VVAGLELRILGPLEVLDDEGHLLDVGGARPRAVLVDLALARGRTMPADQLLEDVWNGEQPARNNLQVQIARLRRVVGEDAIVTRNGGYALELPADAIDAHRFTAFIDAGHRALRAGRADEAATHLRDALSLWRGTPLVDVVENDFARPVITRLEEARLVALEERFEADLSLGRHPEIVGELEAAVQEHPLRERLWAHLMTALYRCGRQADALRAYQRARSALNEELGIDPGPELRNLEHGILDQRPALDAPATGASPNATRQSNLPQLTNSLIGRGTEIAAIDALLAAHRVVTIVGTGGVGKTRLAIEVAHQQDTQYRDGVWLANLAPVGDAADVAATISTALGVEVERGPGAATTTFERLRDYLSGRELLLVLDNCEHLVSEVARIVSELVTRTSQLRVLATSRESLAVSGEALWPLTPLALEDAIALFVMRARAVEPAFDRDKHYETVQTICAQLDGLPLAIELAAARMRALSPDDLVTRLDDRFRLLTGGSRSAPARQQTLRAVIDWSYALLGEEERFVFDRASVFAGGFSLRAAEAVCSGGAVDRDDVADPLARLVDKSLLGTFTDMTGSGFRLLQTLAQYGRERLDTSGDDDETRLKHARYFAAALDIPDGEHGSPERKWFTRLSESIDDVRVAMEWSLAVRNSECAFAIANGLGWDWNMGGRLDDTWRWMTSALALPEPADPAAKIRVLAWAGALGMSRDKARAMAYGADAVARARATGDPRALAAAAMLHGTSIADFFQDRARAVPLIEESVAACIAVGDDWCLAMAALQRGVLRLIEGDFARAPDGLRDAAQRFSALGNPWGRSYALRSLADVLVVRGDYEEAATALHHALVGLRQVGASGVTSSLAARLGYVRALEGRSADAERWFDEALDSAERQRYVPNLALVYNLRGIVLRRSGRLDEAERCHEQAMTLYWERGVPAGLALSLISLGYLAELRGDADRSESLHGNALVAARTGGDVRTEALALDGLAGAAALRGDEFVAGQLFGAAEGLRATTGGQLQPAEAADVDRAVARVHDRAAFDAGLEAGRADPDAVIARVSPPTSSAG
jgi:predicted ATPase/DNA-binding SARP family transcriptional activator